MIAQEQDIDSVLAGLAAKRAQKPGAAPPPADDVDAMLAGLRAHWEPLAPIEDPKKSAGREVAEFGGSVVRGAEDAVQGIGKGMDTAEMVAGQTLKKLGGGGEHMAVDAQGRNYIETKPKENFLTRLGGSMEKEGAAGVQADEEQLRQNTAFLDSFLPPTSQDFEDQIAHQIGGAGVYLAAGAMAGPMGRTAGLLTVSGMAATDALGATYWNAKGAGLSDDEALLKGLESAGVSGAAALVLGRFLEHLNGDPLTHGIVHTLLTEGGTNAVAAMGDTYLQGQIAKAWQAEPGLYEIMRSGAAGGLTGMLLSAGTIAAGAKARGMGKEEPAPKEKVQDQDAIGRAQAVQEPAQAAAEAPTGEPDHSFLEPVKDAGSIPGEAATTSVEPTGIPSEQGGEPTQEAVAPEGARPGEMPAEVSQGSTDQHTENAALPDRTSYKGKPLWEMTRDELSKAETEQRASDKSADVEVLGTLGAKEWDKLHRELNSSDDAKSNAAQKRIAEIEATLSPEKVDRLYGAGEEGAGAEDIRDYLDASRRVELGGTEEELGRSVGYALSRLGEKTNPAEMSHTERLAYSQLQAAFRDMQQRGLDSAKVSDAAMRAAVARFEDPADAAFMLQRFMGEQRGPALKLPNRPKGKQAGAISLPKPLTLEDPETGIESAKRVLADRFTTMRRREEVAPRKGSDFSGAETRMHGRAAAKQRELERLQDQAVEIMRKEKVSAQDMADYMNARHQSARDTVIAGRTGAAGGSGVDPAKAQQILANATPAMKRLAEIHDQVRDSALKFRVDSGLISQEKADAWNALFGPTYTPMKTIGDPSEGVAAARKSLQIRGPEAKRAEGRSSEADNPFVQMFQDAQEVILRGERNVVGQEFGKLASNNPSGLWDPPTKRDIPGEDVFKYKVDGEQWSVKVHDEGTLKALKNLDPVTTNKILRAVAWGGRVMSSLATSRNPEFVLPNFARDLQTAGLNIASENSLGMAAKVVKRTPGALIEIGRALRHPEKATGFSKEFIEHGGVTDWIEPETIHKRIAKIEARLSELPLRTKLRGIARLLGDVSNSVENGVRYAAFKELRYAGVSADKAAVFAKELTVNWSKKGEWGPFANSLYLFFSAGANGTLRMGQVFSKHPARATGVAGSFMAAGYLVSMLNEAHGGKDEKDGELWWAKQNDANKQRYAMVQHTDGETTRLPLAPGWGWFYYLGGALQQHQADIGNVFKSAFHAFSPIEGGSLAQGVSPWFTDPFVEVGENKDFAGRQIHNERYPQDKRPYSSIPNKASGPANAISKLLNRLSGGGEARQGDMDVPPSDLDFIAGEVGSGVGRLGERIVKTTEAILTGKELAWRDTPILARFKGDAPDIYGRGFYNDLDKIDTEVLARKSNEPFNEKIAGLKKAAAATKTRVGKMRDQGASDEEITNEYAAFHKQFLEATK